nr:hypothetical protein [uncultured Dysosmobacter sp.]
MGNFTPAELRLIITLADERRREYLRAADGKETENSRFTDGIFKKAVAMLQEATAPRPRRTAPALTPSRPREGDP